MKIKNAFAMIFASALLVNAENMPSNSLSRQIGQAKQISAPSLEYLVAITSTNNPSLTNLYGSVNAPIYIKGGLKSRFEVVNYFARDPELISKLAECLVGSKVSARKQEDNSYSYFNRASKNTAKFNILYDSSTSDYFVGLYHLRGEKFFFDFETLIYLKSAPKEEGGINFDCEVYSKTDSTLANLALRSRFIKKLVESESKQIIAQFDIVYDSMMKNPKESLRKIEKYTDANGDLYFTSEELEKLRKFYEKLQDILNQHL